MNKVFRVIWNHVTQTWIVVSELSRSKGKTKSIAKVATAVALGVGVSSSVIASVDIKNDQISNGTVNNGHIKITTDTQSAVEDSKNKNSILIATGNESKLNNTASVGIGYNVILQTPDMININGTPTSSLNSADHGSQIAIGNHAQAINPGNGGGQIAIGLNAISSNQNAVAIGTSSKSEGLYNVAIGFEAEAPGVKDGNPISDTVAIGRKANAGGQKSVSLGGESSSKGDYSSSVGPNSKSDGYLSTAVGVKANSQGVQAAALGGYSNAVGNRTVAAGPYSKAFADKSVAVGENSLVAAEQVGSVALGSESQVLARGVDTSEAKINILEYKGFEGTDASKVVSLGNDTLKRQLTNVAAGQITKNSTDVINGSQLYAVADVLGNVAGSMAQLFGEHTELNPDGTVKITPEFQIYTGNKAPAKVGNSDVEFGTKATNIVDAIRNLNEYVNQGFNVKQGDTLKGVVTPTETVSFVDGVGTTANVTEEAEGTTTITFDVKTDGTTIKLNDAGKLTANTSTIAANDKGLAVAATPDTLITAGAVKDAINNSGFNVIADGNHNNTAANKLIKPSNTVTYSAGDNLEIAQVNDDKGAKFTYKLKNEVTLTKDGVTTVLNGKGITITPAAPAKPVKLTDAGLDNGGNKITNVAPGEAPTDAVNVSQLKAAKAQTPFEYAKKDGTPVVKEGDKFYELKVDGTPDLTKEVLTENVDIRAKGVEAKPINNIESGIAASLLASNTGKENLKGAVQLEPEQAKDVTKKLLTLNGKDQLNVAATVGDLQAVAQAGLDFVGNGTGAEEVHRALGTKLTIVGERTDTVKELADSAADNILVESKKDGNKLTVKLAKNLQNIKSIKDAANGPSITINDNDITLAKGSEAVQLKGVKAGTSDTDAVNVAQLTAVDAGNNVTIASNKDNTTGKTTYTVNAEKTTVSAKTGSTDVVVTPGTKDQQGVTNYAVDLTDGAKAKLAKADTALQTVTGTKGVEVTKAGDTVTIKAKVDDSTIKINDQGQLSANTSTITADNAGKVTAATPDTLITSGAVANAINNAGWNVDVDHDDTAFTDKAGQGKTLVKNGSDVVFKSGKNLKVKKDGQNITFATLDDVNFTSVQLGENGPKLSADGNNIKIANKDGGATKITNVAAGKELTDAVNVSQLKMAENQTPFTYADQTGTPVVKLGDNFYPAGTSLQNGKFVDAAGVEVAPLDVADIVVKAKGTTPQKVTNVANNLPVTINGVQPTTEQNPPSVTDITKFGNNAATVNDILNAGFNLQGNGEAKDFVKAYDTINFVNGNGTTAVVDNTDGLTSKIKYDVKVDDTTIKVNTDGKLEAIIPELETGKVSVADGKATVIDADKTKLAKAGDVVNAINNSGFTLKTNATGLGEKVSGDNEVINPGDAVEMVAGDNLSVKQEAEGKVTYALKDVVTFNKDGVSTIINNKGITVIPADAITGQPTKPELDVNKIVALTDNGIAAGGKKIINVADGVDKTDAVNKGQLDAKLGSFTVGADKDATAAGITIDKDNTRFDVVGKDGIATSVDGNKINVALDKATQDKLDKAATDAANSPFEFTKADGTPVVKDGDKYYTVNADGTKQEVPANEAAKVVIKAKDLKPVTNIASGIGLGNYNGTADVPAKYDQESPTSVTKAQEAATSLYALDGNNLNKAATTGDLQALAVAGLDFVGNDNAEKAAEVAHRALGTKLSIVGERDDNALDLDALKSAKNNIVVHSSRKDSKLTVKLAKDLQNITSISNGTTTDGTKLTFGDGAITLAKGTDLVQLKGVKAGVDGTDAVNVSQLKTAENQTPFTYADQTGTPVVKLGDNFYPAGTVLNSAGDAVDASGAKVTALTADKIVIKAKGTEPQKVTNVASNLPKTVNGVADVLTKQQLAPTTEEIAKFGNNAATVNDILNAGFNLKANGVAKDFVKAYDIVDFVDGAGTTAVVDNTDGLTSKIKYNVKVDGKTIKVNTDGKLEAIAPVIDTTDLTAAADGKIVNPNDEDSKKLISASDVAKAINNSGFNVIAAGNLDGTAQKTLVKPGDTVTYTAGDNLEVKQEGQKFTFATKKDVVFDSALFKKEGEATTAINNDGIFIVPADNLADPTKVVALTSKGINAGSKQIINVESGLKDANGNAVNLADAKDGILNNAVNVGDLKSTINNLNNADNGGGFGLKDQDGVEVKQNLGETVQVIGDRNIKTKVVDVTKDGKTTKALEVSLASITEVGGLGKDGQPGEDGQIGVKGKDGKTSVVLNGKDGTIGLTGPAGKDGINPTTNIGVANGKPGVDGKDGTTKTRIVYETKNGQEEVATLNDGLKFGANAGDVHNAKLNTQVNVKGAATNTDYSKFDAGKNIMTQINGDTITVALAKDLEVDSVKAGDTTINNNGLTINNGPSVTKSGINASGTKITNLAEGKADGDAVNVKQLTDLADNLKAATTDVKGNQGVTVTPTTDTETGKKTFTVAANVDDTTIEIKKDGKLAVKTTDLTAAAAGNIVKPNNEDKTKLISAGDVAKAINNSGFNVIAAGNLNGTAQKTLVKPGDTVTYTAGDNLEVKQEGQKFTFATKKDVVFDSALFKKEGEATTAINNDGIFIVPADNLADPTKVVALTSKGINAGSKKIINVADGDINADSKDAVNGSQLFKLQENITNVKNDAAKKLESFTVGAGEANGITVDKDNARFDVVGVDEINTSVEGNKINVSLSQDAKDKLAKAGTSVQNVTGDTNINATKDGDTIKVALNKDIDLTDNGSIKVGGVTINNEGINAGGKKITNVAEGKNDTDAVNVKQLKDTTTDVTGDQGVTVETDTNPTTGKKTVTVAAKVDDATIEVNANGQLAAKTATLVPSTDGDVAIKAPDADGKKLITAGDVANAINSSGLIFGADTGTEYKAKLGTQVNVKGDDTNISTNVEGNNIKVKLNDNIKVKGATIAKEFIVENGATINMGNNVVSGVAPGRIAQDSTDAVNGSQLYQVQSQVNNNSNAINQLGNQVNKIDKDLKAGIAGATAIAFLQRPNEAGKSIVSLAAGSYKSESAVAIGYARNSDNNKISIKLGAGMNTRGDTNFGGSIGYQW